jgi:predicted dehydrogenase
MTIDLAIVGTAHGQAIEHYVGAARAIDGVTFRTYPSIDTFRRRGSTPDLLVLADPDGDVVGIVGAELRRGVHVLSDGLPTSDLAVVVDLHAMAFAASRMLRIGLPRRRAVALPRTVPGMGTVQQVAIRRTVRAAGVGPAHDALLLDPLGIDRLAQALSHLGGVTVGTVAATADRREATLIIRFQGARVGQARQLSLVTRSGDRSREEMRLVGAGRAELRFADPDEPDGDAGGQVTVSLRGRRPLVRAIPGLAASRALVLGDALRAIAGPPRMLPRPEDALLIRVIAAAQRSLREPDRNGKAAVVEL